jgi:uncharacterized protein YjbJ (UPF0337 family)
LTTPELKGRTGPSEGTVKEKWEKLTDDDLDVIEGKRDQLIGRLQERYGYSKDQAEKELKSWK